MPLTLPLQMVELKRVIDEDQRTYVQWAEEKLSLANIAADLLIQHRTAVDKDVGALLAELKVTYHPSIIIFATCMTVSSPSHLFSGSQQARAEFT